MKRVWFVICTIFLIGCLAVGVSAAEAPIKSARVNSALSREVQDRLNEAAAVDMQTKLTEKSSSMPIGNATQLAAFRDRVNSGETSLSAYLTADINLYNQYWTSIGLSNCAFTGTFDGKGYEIYNLNAITSGTRANGLFGRTDGALICDLSVSGTVTGGLAGGIVGSATDTYVVRCANWCAVTGVGAIGGIAGMVSATYDANIHSSAIGVSSGIMNCVNNGDISNMGSDTSFVGGIAATGSGYTTISSCYNVGSISCSNGPSGGIIGTMGKDTFVVNTYNVGFPKTVDTFGEIAGFASQNGGIANSYFCKTKYAPIGRNDSTWDHEVFYCDSYALMKAPSFVALLNKGSKENDFMYDQYYMNYGFPVLNWEKPVTFFTDVSLESWYATAVNWAFLYDVTSGTSEYEFSPNQTCTRAQTVTFLWRAAGCPNPKNGYMPFSDVKRDSYYYNAVLWAVESGITSGTSTTTFSPNATVSRASVVTFLWRMENMPAGSGFNPFVDVRAQAYYYNAVLWAVNQSITEGTSQTTFSPNSGCTRAQIVTFLFRYFE